GGPDCRTHMLSFGDHVVAGHARGAGGRREQRRQHVHGRRLAGSVRAEEAVDLARGDGKIDPVHGAWPVLELPDEVGRLDRVIAHRRKSLLKYLMLSNTYLFK